MFGIARLNAIVLRLVDTTYCMAERIIAGQNTVSVAFQHEAFVGMNNVLERKLADIDTFFRGINVVDQRRICTFKHFVGLFKDIHIKYFVSNVVLTKNADRTSLHPQVDILSDKDRLHLGILRHQPVGHSQNLMVRFVLRERIVHTFGLYIASHNKQFSQSFPQRSPFRKQIIISNFI